MQSLETRRMYSLPPPARLLLTSLLSAGLAAAGLAAAGVAAASPDPAQRVEVRKALEKAGDPKQRSTLTLPASLADHPLLGYIEYATLRRDLKSLDRPRIEDFLQRNPDLAVAPLLRNGFLGELARRKDWQGFLALYQETDSVERRCQHLQARLATAGTDSALLDDAEVLWLSPTSVPDACDAAFAALEQAGRLTAELRWKRIDLALAAGNGSLARYLARGLAPAERPRAEQLADFVDAPTAAASSWTADARSRSVVTDALVRHARREPGNTRALLQRLAGPLQLDADPRGRVASAVALWTAANYFPEAADRFAEVPLDAYDEQLHEWRVRNALARQDLQAALNAIEAMPAAQRGNSQWRYTEARLRERAGDTTRAAALYADAAQQANFHGFLAADRSDVAYTLCPLEPSQSPELRAAVAQNQALVRALELFAVEQPHWAELEWRKALAGLDDAAKPIAVELANREHWYDRAMFTLNSGDDLRYYSLRFPLNHERHLREQARLHRLDPAWVAALIRSESAWMPRARSSADARGLMQVLPGTGAQTARALGQPWQGGTSLYDPQTNISLGTAYLRAMLERHQQQAFQATAAYNAGPAPVARWLSQRPALDPDLWIEAIPYRETREYVPRVMAFSVIYDWRLDGDAAPLSERLLGRFDGRTRKAFRCPEAVVDAT